MKRHADSSYLVAALRVAGAADDHRSTGRVGCALSKSLQLYPNQAGSVFTGPAARSQHDRTSK